MLLLDPASVWRVATAWHPATRVAFRFFATYFTLYVLTTQMLPGMVVLPVGDLPNLGEHAPVRPVVSWVATHVFRVSYPLVITGSGSGDKTYDWVHAFCVLALSTLITVGWSALDRRREHHSQLQQWVRLFARFALGSTMVSYGMVKAIPLQMPAPGLTRLLEPFGHFSPMGVLWYRIVLLSGRLDLHLLVCGRGPTPPARVGPHPHALPALASLAPLVTRSQPLGLAIRPKKPPQNADPSGQGLLNSGAERSEALAGRGGGAPRRATKEC